MNDLKAKPADICMADAMPFHQHWEYRTTFAVADLINDQFFLPVRNMLRAGDSVTICCYDSSDDKTKRLQEVVTVRVVQNGDKAVEVVQVGDIVKVPEARIQDSQGDTGPVYSVKKDFGAGFLVKDGMGNVVDRFDTKREAEDFASQLNGEQKAA